VPWAIPSSGFFPREKPPSRAPKKGIFTPVFAQTELFLAIFNQFLRLFMTPSKVNITQNKWVRSVFLPEKGTPPPPYLL
jgi:hypothetical protein